MLRDCKHDGARKGFLSSWSFLSLPPMSVTDAIAGLVVSLLIDSNRKVASINVKSNTKY